MFGGLKALVDDDALGRRKSDCLTSAPTRLFLDAHPLFLPLGFSSHVQRDRQNEKLACK